LFSVNAFSSAENHIAKIASTPLEPIPHSVHSQSVPVLPSFRRADLRRQKIKRSTHPQAITSKNKKEMLLCRLIQPARA
jgi:hypothetical protein